MIAAFARIFVASLRRRPLSALLSLLAIALGVALGLAVQLIHRAALDEFERGMRVLAGTADLQVVGPRSGFDEAVFLALAQRPEIEEASPMVEVEARLGGRGDTIGIHGVDVFRVARLQPGLLPVADADADRLAALDPDNVFLSPAARALVGGELRIALHAGGTVVEARVAGGVPGAGEGLAIGVMDIAAVQERFGLLGRLTRIDLRLARGVDRDEARHALAQLLPPGSSLLTPDSAQGQARRLSRAYRTNLTMLAGIALVTGGFLVFSTQWLAVVRRRQELAFLRALGVDRRRLTAGLLTEGAALGVAGGLLGIAVGHAMAVAIAGLVGADLGAGYFHGIEPQIRFAPPVAAAYLFLGVAAGVLGALPPARAAARQPAARGLRAGDAEGALEARSGRWPALLAVTAAGVLSLLPPIAGVPLAGYIAVALILVAAVLVLPDLVRLATLVPPGERGVLWRLARSRLAAAPGQAVVAGAGVAASVAVVAAMAIMVASFRASVDEWLSRVLPADLYVRAQGDALDEASASRVAAVPGVRRVDPTRRDSLRLSDELPPVALIARPLPDAEALPLVDTAERPLGFGALTEGGAGREPGATAPPRVWISEAVVDLYGVAVGDRMQLPLRGRLHAFAVAGVWRDYARQHGAVVVDLADYRLLTGDLAVDDLAVHLAAGADPGEVAARLRRVLGEDRVEITAPGEIRARTLAIFDRTFFITYLMEAVAVVIGLFGIATAFAALATARRHEFGMLRHLGLTRDDVGRLLALEGALCSAVAVAAGLVAGGGIAWVLVEVVNRQSFHWSMDLRLPMVTLGAFALALVLLAAVAARVAGAHAMRRSAVIAVREDW